MRSARTAIGAPANRPGVRAAEPEPVSPELVLVCPELRARTLEQMREEAAAAVHPRPADVPAPSGRRSVLLRPTAVALVALPPLVLAIALVAATMRRSGAAAVSFAPPAAVIRMPGSGARARLASRTVKIPPSTHAHAAQPGRKLDVHAHATLSPPTLSRHGLAKALQPLHLTSAETEPSVSLLGPLPDPTPPSRRLAPATGRELLSLAQARHVDWATLLARARVHAHGMHAITMRQLRPLARALATTASGGAPASRTAASSRTSERERVLAGYYRAVGLDALITGLAGAKPVLAARVLRDPRITIYAGGRRDVASGRVNVRVLALVLYLARTQGQVTVTSLVSGHDGPATQQGSSAHAYGLAADISALGHIPVEGHQQPGGRLDRALHTLLLLPTEVRPTQLISLLYLGASSLALADHTTYVHIGYAPVAHNTPDNLRAIWQSAGARYGIPWQVLAAINKIETDNGRTRGTSPAGAIGWMQFLPSTWRQYATDGNGDGIANPQNPADAIFTAARFLQAAGGDTNLRRAIYAYNHADWYVKDVLAQARSYH